MAAVSKSRSHLRYTSRKVMQQTKNTANSTSLGVKLYKN